MGICGDVCASACVCFVCESLPVLFFFLMVYLFLCFSVFVGLDPEVVGPLFGDSKPFLVQSVGS